MKKKERLVKKAITFDYINRGMAIDLISKAHDRCDEIVKNLWTDDVCMTKVLSKLSESVWAKLAFSICLQSSRGEKNAKQQIDIINDFRQLLVLDVHRGRSPPCLDLGSYYHTAYTTLCVFIDEYASYQKTHTISENFWIYSELGENQQSVVIEQAESILKFIQDMTAILIHEMTEALEQRICLRFPELKELSAMHDSRDDSKGSVGKLRFSENNTIHEHEHSENISSLNQSNSLERAQLSMSPGLIWDQNLASRSHVPEQEEQFLDGLCT